MPFSFNILFLYLRHKLRISNILLAWSKMSLGNSAEVWSAVVVRAPDCLMPYAVVGLFRRWCIFFIVVFFLENSYSKVNNPTLKAKVKLEFILSTGKIFLKNRVLKKNHVRSLSMAYWSTDYFLSVSLFYCLTFNAGALIAHSWSC